MQSRKMVMSPGSCNSQFRFRLPWNAYGLGANPIESRRVLWFKFIASNLGELTTELNEKKGI